MNIFKKIFGVNELEAEIARLTKENAELKAKNKNLTDELEVVSYGLYHEKTYWEALWRHECYVNSEFVTKYCSKEQLTIWKSMPSNQKAVEKWSEELTKRFGDDSKRLNRKYREMLGEKF